MIADSMRLRESCISGGTNEEMSEILNIERRQRKRNQEGKYNSEDEQDQKNAIKKRMEVEKNNNKIKSME